MSRAVDLRRQRRDRWRREGERSVWRNLGLFGALGWLIVVPALLGAFAGRWLDRNLGTGVTFSAALIFLGACAGLYLAWRRAQQEPDGRAEESSDGGSEPE